MDSGVSSDDACVREEEDESGSLRWIIVVIEDISLYQLLIVFYF